MSKDSRVPSYRRHKQSGQAIVTLPDGLGGRRDILLGKHGTKESRVEYARIISEWEVAGHRLPASPAAKDLTVNELILAYWKHAEQHYRRPDGTKTKELSDIRLSCRPLKELYGHTAAKDFGPLALKALREAMIGGSWMTDKQKVQQGKRGKPIAWSRKLVNQRIGRLRRIFRWAVSEQLLAASLYEALRSVEGLQRGRCLARETESVKPVPAAFVEATLPFLRPPVAAMAKLQLLAGMRPGEVVIMRALDIDMTGKIWLYRPGSDRGPHGEHKTAWRGHDRIIAIGPRAQEVIKPFLKPDLQAFLFSPAESMAAFRADQRAARKSKVQPTQVNRKKRKPKKRPGQRYTVASYGRAIEGACKKADAAAHQKDPKIPADQVVVPHWHPNQLRHAKATEIRREAGLDAARVVLGHRSPAITEVYAEIDVNKAAEVMARLG
jgi:integrase